MLNPVYQIKSNKPIDQKDISAALLEMPQWVVFIELPGQTWGLSARHGILIRFPTEPNGFYSVSGPGAEEFVGLLVASLKSIGYEVSSERV